MSLVFTHRRAPRLQLSDATPAQLRYCDGQLSVGKLLVLSATGGLLDLSPALAEHQHVTLTFETRKGPVQGTAEMLAARGGASQAFRFTSLSETDRDRMEEVILGRSEPQPINDLWIEKYRACLAQERPRKPGLIKRLAATFSNFS